MRSSKIPRFTSPSALIKRDQASSGDAKESARFGMFVVILHRQKGHVVGQLAGECVAVGGPCKADLGLERERREPLARAVGPSPQRPQVADDFPCRGHEVGPRKSVAQAYGVGFNGPKRLGADQVGQLDRGLATHRLR